MIRRPPRSTLSSSSAASDVYKRQQRPGAGDGGKVMTEQDPLWRWHIIVPILIDVGWGGAAIIQHQHLGRDEGTVITIGKGEDAQRSQQDGKCIHGSLPACSPGAPVAGLGASLPRCTPGYQHL